MTAKTRSTGCNSLPQVKRYCQKLFNEGVLGDNPNMTFDRFTEGFFNEASNYCKWRKVSRGQPVKPETLRRYNTGLNYQLLPFFHNMKLSSINTATIKRWIICAIEKGPISTNPLVRIPYRKIDKKSRELLTLEEIKSIFSASWVDDVQRSMFLLAVISGMRIGEISALQSSDCHGNYIEVTKTLSERYGLGTTKTGVKRIVPVPEAFLSGLDVQNKWLFTKDGVNPVKPHNVYNSFTRICERLGIDVKARVITLHTLRNFFISYMTGANIPQIKIKAVVGHADENMTDHYTYFNEGMLKDIQAIQKEMYIEITSQRRVINGKWQI